jgi:hypothetical protein
VAGNERLGKRAFLARLSALMGGWVRAAAAELARHAGPFALLFGQERLKPFISIAIFTTGS